MQVQVRPANATDGEALATLRRACRLEKEPDRGGHEQTFLAGFLTWWHRSQASHRAVIASIDGVDCGMGFLAIVGRVPDPDQLDRNHGDLQSVYVLPERRAQGVGTQIVAALIDIAASVGCDKVTVHSGRRSVALYERAGFSRHDRILTLSLTE